VADFTGALLGAKLERGTISVTPGDVLVFLVTVYAAHLLSVFLRFVLNEEVYPRTRITAGTSYAASYLLHYVILAVGFMAALGMMGVDFTHVTVLVSAFGVGLGFGLQSVVHNFVSGLILLFERPVHVGDAIETDTIQGEIKRIGIRASVVRTWQGAEVMVPNSQLVSEKVTNWTLSDRHRRIDLPLGISYSANPAAVIALVESVARANPEVVASPPPACFLVGYGDSGVNFELRAWTDQFDNWFRVRGELALAIYEAVQAAPEMSFPFPQREVRVVLDPNTETRNVLVDTLRETADEG
jgi:small-conductance mechanosensitive channel